MVGAEPEQVADWWFHSDRRTDYQERIQRTGVAAFSQTESIEEGVGVRTTRWKDKRGWIHESRVETRRDTDGRPLPSPDGSYPLTQHATLTAPLHYKVIFTCTGRIEFKEHHGRSTEIIVTHNHTASGGTRFNRRNIRNSNQGSEPRDFQDLIDRCRVALAPSVKKPLDSHKRPLTPEERQLLDAFLGRDFPGAAELREQARSVEASQGCPCGCGTISLHPSDASEWPHATVRSNPLSAGTVVDESGEAVGGLLLFLKDGILDSFEVYSFGDPLPLPPVELVEWEKLT